MYISHSGIHISYFDTYILIFCSFKVAAKTYSAKLPSFLISKVFLIPPPPFALEANIYLENIDQLLKLYPFQLKKGAQHKHTTKQNSSFYREGVLIRALDCKVENIDNFGILLHVRVKV